MSFGVDDLDRAMVELAKRGAVPGGKSPHSGLIDWLVADLETEDRHGVRFHLTQVG